MTIFVTRNRSDGQFKPQAIPLTLTNKEPANNPKVVTQNHLDGPLITDAIFKLEMGTRQPWQLASFWVFIKTASVISYRPIDT